jgi:hypothetical protein
LGAGIGVEQTRMPRRLVRCGPPHLLPGPRFEAALLILAGLVLLSRRLLTAGRDG